MQYTCFVYYFSRCHVSL